MLPIHMVLPIAGHLFTLPNASIHIVRIPASQRYPVGQKVSVCSNDSPKA